MYLCALRNLFLLFMAYDNRNRIAFYRRLARGISFPLLVWILHSCATPTAPQGGPRDETPPQIIVEESTPNLQTNFEKQTIELTFDEWVTLENIRDEVIVSPPLSADPEYKLKRRTVQVIFPDTVNLREDVTYTINFGEAVKDLNEKNPAEDLRFVFSTGDFIDSLKISGRIVDAQTGEPQEKVLFLLYDNLTDSVVYEERPFYFGRTGEDGRFEINNIREGTYKGFALKDQGVKKYLFESPGEPLAFPDSLIAVGPDTTIELELKMFQQNQILDVSDIDTAHYGKVRVTFNQPIFEPDLAYENVVDTPLVRIQGDSLVLWYTQTTPWTLYVNPNTANIDTFAINAGGRETLLSQDSMAIQRGGRNQKLIPGKPPTVRYNHPVATIDTALITLYVDTSRNSVRPDVRIDPADPLQMVVNYSWKEDISYELEILPGAVGDIFGLSTTDTLLRTYTLDPLSRFGNILLTLSNLDSTEQYLVQLMSKDLKQTLFSDEVSGQPTYETQWRTIEPGDYTLRVITDWNRNGRWDTGNYEQRLQPEPIYLRPLEKLRANWDLEADIVYGEVIAEPEPAPEETNTNNRNRPGRN